MRKVLSLFIVFALSGFFLCGCNSTINVAEALQLKKNSKLYTAYNVWYEDQSDIDAENIIKGDFLPFGSQISVDEAISNSYFGFSRIVLRDISTDEDYVIKFSNNRMLMTPENFLRNLLTTKNKEEQQAVIRAEYLEKVEKGRVVRGMNRKEVFKTYGPPPKSRTPSSLDDTWVYWNGDNGSFRIVFGDDGVKEIIDLSKF